MTIIPLCPVMSGIPQMHTFSQTTLTINFSIGGLQQMDRLTDGQKSPNDSSNPSAYALWRGLKGPTIISVCIK